MKLLAIAISMFSLTALANDVRTVAPALEKYAQDRLFGEVWKRSGLSPRDRSIVTLAALIARNQTGEMPYHVNHALDNGVKPAEISEIITHLAFYSGWGNAMSAVAVTRDIFAKRRIGADQIAQVSPKLLPVDEKVRGRSRSASWRAIRRRGAGRLAIHDRYSLPRPVAAPGSRAA